MAGAGTILSWIMGVLMLELIGVNLTSGYMLPSIPLRQRLCGKKNPSE